MGWFKDHLVEVSGKYGIPIFEPYCKLSQEVKDLIEEVHSRTMKILLDHKDGFVTMAKLLLEKEVIFAEDVERIFGPRPWASRTDELLADEAPDPSQPPHKGEENKEKQVTE